MPCSPVEDKGVTYSFQKGKGGDQADITSSTWHGDKPAASSESGGDWKDVPELSSSQSRKHSQLPVCKGGVSISEHWGNRG